MDFRAMTPGKFWEATDVDAVVDETMLGTWFDAERRITEVLAIEADTVGSLRRAGYRFKAKRTEGEFVIEQQAYVGTDGEEISGLRIMCSGFQPPSEPCGSAHRPPPTARHRPVPLVSGWRRRMTRHDGTDRHVDR